MKKSFVILLCVLLLIQNGTVSCVKAEENLILNGSFEETVGGNPAGWLTYDYAVSRPTAPASGENILLNGDFESFTNNQASGWTYQNAKYMEKSRTVVHGGESAIAMTGGHISQSVSVQPSSSYMFSGWTYLDAENTSGISVTIIFYTADGIPCGKRYYDSALPATGQWYELTITATAPENCASALLYAYMSNTEGKCYYDDFRFFRLEEEPFRFETDEIFYYADNETGKAVVHALNGAEYTVDFSVSFNGTVIATKKNISFSGNTAEYNFPLSLLSELKKEYVISASVKKNGETVQNFKEAIYKYPRPSKLTKEGLYMDGGEVFDPVIAYHVYGEDYKVVGEAGINVIELSPDLDTIMNTLDTLQAYGLKALIALCNGPAWMKPAAHPGNIEHTRAVVSLVKDHPAVFGYYAMDEPFVRRDTEMIMEWMRESYKMIRDIDDAHPVYVCDAYDFALTSRYADIVACEPYPYSQNAAKVTGQMEMAMRNVKSGKPVYAILQTFSASGSSFFPSGENVRDQVCRAFESGAKGIGYYSFSDAHSDTNTPLHEMMETWEEMIVLAQKELPILFGCYSHNSFTDFNGSANEGELGSLYYRSFMEDDGKTAYVMTHNRSTSAQTVNVPLVSHNGKVRIGKYTAEATDTKSFSGSETISAVLAAGEARLYKVTPESAVNISLLSLGEGIYLLSAEETGAKDGIQYIELPVKGAGILQRIDGLVPEQSYELSLWYRGSVEDALKLEIQFFHHDENGFMAWDAYCSDQTEDFIREEKSYVEYFGSVEPEGGVWREIKFDFYTPKYANALSLCIEAYKNDSYLCVDNLFLSRCGTLNLVKNGGFDNLKRDKTLSGGWFAYDEYMQTYGNVGIENGCIQLAEGMQSANIRQFVFLEEGKHYRLSFQYENDKGYAPSVGLFTTASNGNTITEWGIESIAGSRKQYSACFVAGSTEKYTLWLSDKTAKGTCCFDDVILTYYEPDFPEIHKETGKVSGSGALKDISVVTGISNAAGKYDTCLLWKDNSEKDYVFAVYDEGENEELHEIRFISYQYPEDIRKVPLNTSAWSPQDNFTLKLFGWEQGFLNTLETVAVLH